MDYDEFTAVTKPAAPPTIGVSDLHGPDRTLLSGWTVNHETVHVYLKDGQIHQFTYTGGYSGRPVTAVSYDVGHYGVAADFVPDKRVIPAATDAEFARLLTLKGVTIPWANFDQDQHERAAAVAFYGAVYEAERPISTVPEGSHGSDWSGARVSDGGWTGRQI